MNKLNGVGYVRVSSISQKQEGISLELQELEIEKLFVKKGLVRGQYKIFNEGAASGREVEHRDLFIEAIDTAIANECQFFAVYDLSRFARNVNDAIKYFKLLRSYNIKLISTRQEIEDSPEGYLLYVIQSGMNEYHSVKLSYDVKKAHNHLREQGIFPHKAPLGYKNLRTDGRASLIIDEAIAPLIHDAYLKYANGELNSLEEVAKYFYDNGYRHGITNRGLMRKQKVSWIFNNPFYYGYFYHKDELIMHKYERIIDKELFDRVQKKLNGKSIQTGTYKKINGDYPLKTICKCTECARKLFGAPSKGNGGVYHYYYCRTKNCNKATGTEIVHDLFRKELMGLEPTEGTLSLFAEILKRTYRQKTVSDESKRDKLIKQVDILKKTKNEVQQSFISAKSDSLRAGLEERYSDVEKEIKSLEFELQNAKSFEENCEPIIDEGVEKLKNPLQEWESAKIERKTMYQNWLYPQGISFHYKTGLQTNELCFTYRFIRHLRDKKSQMVGVAGLEPTTPRSQSVYSSQLNYTPIYRVEYNSKFTYFQLLSIVSDIRKPAFAGFSKTYLSLKIDNH